MRDNFIEEMYRKYYGSLKLMACTYTHSEPMAEDLVQSAFLKAMISYEDTGSFLSWANTVMRNEFYNICRKDNRLTDIENYGYEYFKAQDDILAEYIEKEEKRELYTMISMLPMKYREVMIESVYLSKSNEEIARDRGVSEGSIRQIRSRAKKMLIKMMEVRDGE